MTREINRRETLIKAVAAIAVTAFPTVLSNRVLAAGKEVSAHQVDITGFEFAPTILKVRPGDTITWTNRDIAPHTATARDGSWDTGRLNKGQSATITVTSGFSSAYFCTFHPMMKASLEIISI